MTDLERRALAKVPLNPIQVHHLYCTRDTSPGVLQGHIATLCESHTRIQQELEGVTKLIAEPANQVASREAETRLKRIEELEAALLKIHGILMDTPDSWWSDSIDDMLDAIIETGVVKRGTDS